jgi:hypothetical protein
MPLHKDILRWHTGLKRLTSENLSFLFSSDLHIGYSHHILTGNGSTNDAIAFPTTQQITHVMFFAPFPRGLQWPSDMLRSFLHYQCHIMSWSKLRFDTNVAVYCLRGLQQMPIQWSQFTTQFTLLSSNGRIVGHCLADIFSPEDPSLIIQAITNGRATMVSDRSYKPFLSTEIGAAAWILECSVT